MATREREAEERRDLTIEENQHDWKKALFPEPTLARSDTEEAVSESIAEKRAMLEEHLKRKRVKPVIGTLASDVEREDVRWLWEGFAALGKITILDGDPGVGKSTLLCDLAARVSTRSEMPTGKARIGGGVVLVNGEDSESDTILPRLAGAGAEVRRCLIVSSVPEGDTNRPLTIPNDLPLLEQALEYVEGRLLIIDPLVAHLDSGTNTYRDHDVRRALAPLAEMADRKNVAVILVRHLNKSLDAKALYRGGGSIGIIGAARIGLLMGYDPHDSSRRVIACSKNNLARLPKSVVLRLIESGGVARVSWEGRCGMSADELLHTPTTSKQEDARDFLRKALENGPQPSADLFQEAEEHGISNKTLRRAKEGIAVSKKVGGQDGHWVWQLADD